MPTPQLPPTPPLPPPTLQNTPQPDNASDSATPVTNIVAYQPTRRRFAPGIRERRAAAHFGCIETMAGVAFRWNMTGPEDLKTDNHIWAWNASTYDKS
ncbi:hypothetical protein [Paraburkholderia caribensis]|uniref:hypothetical protein n=1 Tax=Paraburkholderia caribensis TaxID=75105 RepID=UPI0013149D23|nr:hypothetical protein [Paraburkholderia caribensis]